MKETLEEVKDLAYYRANAEEDYLQVPISVLRYISELEEQSYTEQDMLDYVLYVELVNARGWFRSPLQPKEWFKQIKSKQDE